MTQTVILLFLGELYAIVVVDVTDPVALGDGHIVGDQAVNNGVTLVVIGAAITANAIFQCCG